MYCGKPDVFLQRKLLDCVFWPNHPRYGWILSWRSVKSPGHQQAHCNQTKKSRRNQACTWLGNGPNPDVRQKPRLRRVSESSDFDSRHEGVIRVTMKLAT